MPAHSSPENTAPYKIGDKIKVYVKDSPTYDNELKLLTFGSVVRVDGKNKPLLEYKDFSDLPLDKFNRFLMISEVRFDDLPNSTLPYVLFKLVNGKITRY